MVAVPHFSSFVHLLLRPTIKMWVFEHKSSVTSESDYFVSFSKNFSPLLRRNLLIVREAFFNSPRKKEN